MNELRPFPSDRAPIPLSGGRRRHVRHTATTNPDGTVTVLSQTLEVPDADHTGTWFKDDFNVVFGPLLRRRETNLVAEVVLTLDGERIN